MKLTGSIPTSHPVAHFNNQDDEVTISNHAKDPIVIDPIPPKFAEVTLERLSKLPGIIYSLNAVLEKAHDPA